MKRPPFDPTLEQALADMSRRIEEGRSSSAAKPAGSISVPNGDGTRTVLGVAAGTSGVAPWVGDTTAPGKPTGMSAVSHNGTVLARWDGTLNGGVPADFSHVEVTASYGSTTLDLGALTSAGELPSGVIAAGTVVTITAMAFDDAHAQDGTPAPNASLVSDPVQVTVQGSVDPAIIDELNSKLDTAQGDLATAQTNIGTAQQTATDAAIQAAQAASAANLAQQTAQGLVSYSTTAPSNPVSGQVWFPTDASGNVTGMQQWTGTQWATYALMAGSVIVPGSVATLIQDGQITTGMVSAAQIAVSQLTVPGQATIATAVAQAIWAGIVNAQVANIQDLHATTAAIDSAVIGQLAAQIITASVFRTADSGARVLMDGSGLHAFNSAGVGTFDLTGETGNIQGATVKGSAIQGSTFDLIGAAGESGIVNFVDENYATAAKTANAITGATSSSDEYAGFSIRSTTTGATLTGNWQSAGSDGDLKFTVARSGAEWVWVAYNPPSSVVAAIPDRGTKTLTLYVKASAVQPAVNLVAGFTSVDDGTPSQFQGDHVILDAGVWTPLTATIPPDVSLSWLSINLPGAPDDSALTVEVDDLTVSGASSNGSTLRIGYDAAGNAGIVMYDQNGDKTVNIDGVNNLLTGAMIAGNAHLASWSDGSGNTRSGILLDDAAGTKANETDAPATPRLISNRDPNGKVDTILSTGADASGNQAWVDLSGSAQSAVIGSRVGGYQSQLTIRNGATMLSDNSASGSAAIYLDNAWVNLIGKLGFGKANSTFLYGLFETSTSYAANSSGYWTVNTGLPAAAGQVTPIVTGKCGPDARDIIATVYENGAGYFRVSLHNASGVDAGWPGFYWFLVNGANAIQA